MKHIGLAKPLQYKNTRAFHTATDIHGTTEDCMITGTVVSVMLASR